MNKKMEKIRDKNVEKKNKKAQHKMNQLAAKYFDRLGVDMPKNINVEYVRFREPMKKHKSEIYLKYRSIDTDEYFEQVFKA